MKKILGLDIGTNSIGAALLSLPEKIEDYGKEGKIEWAGSRIIPVDGDTLSKFENGSQIQTPAAQRRILKGSRRLKQRYVLRRTRLIKVIKILGWVSQSYPEDFKKQFKEDPTFKFKINDYLPFSDDSIKECTKILGVANKRGKLAISEDWVIYYLRKKALLERITKYELARIIYMMNQRRGFKSSRKDLRNVVEETFEKKWVEPLTVVSIEEDVEAKTSKDRKKTFLIKAIGEIGSPSDGIIREWIVKRFNMPEWIGNKYTFLCTEKNGKFLTPQLPSEDDWELCMVSLDNQIRQEGKHPGEFFFDKLEKNKNYKIRQQVVKRKKYRDELEAIWKKQTEYWAKAKDDDNNPNLNDSSKLEEIGRCLYPTQAKTNMSQYRKILNNDLLGVIAEDIIYYQRDLKSQKSSIAGCQFERRIYQDKATGEEKIVKVKVAPKSSPFFQEFRIWQDIHNMRIIAFEKNVEERILLDQDVTSEYLNPDSKAILFELFDSVSEVSEDDIFKKLAQKGVLSKKTHRINLYRNREKLKGNETKTIFRKVFNKHDFKDGLHLLDDATKFYSLWHIFYSIDASTDSSEQVEIFVAQKGVRTALKNAGFDFPKEVISHLCKPQKFTEGYASISTNAIRKLLPLMRSGKYWKEEGLVAFHNRIREVIEDGGITNVDEQTGEIRSSYLFKKVEDFQCLPVWIACYVVYKRHSERESDDKFTSVEEMDIMKLLPNNSMRNPIAEQVIRETLRVVKEVCRVYGQPNEIHIELARELKKNADERKKASDINAKNFTERQNIKKLLLELFNEGFEFDIKPNPESPRDIDRFNIWKGMAESSQENQQRWDDLFKGKRIPTGAEVKRYSVWMEQQCMSPYTGKIIPLSKLFNGEEYDLDHVIPRSRLKYDSPVNLVVCESGVNKFKGNDLASLFIKYKSGQTLPAEYGGHTLLNFEGYVERCNSVFKSQRSKLKNLLSEEVPKDFISRQLNDTRYINRKLKELLYPFAKDKGDILSTSGSITSELRQEWGMSTLWKQMMMPRFERLEKKMNKEFIVEDSKKEGQLYFNVPENPDLDIKRIDHRNHALDAIVIAATTREHIRYLNSLNAADTDNEIAKIKRSLVKKKIREFKMPWANFTGDAREVLDSLIVSFKQANKIFSKPKNKALKWVQNPTTGGWEKKAVAQRQPKDDSKKWLAVRKSMFKQPKGSRWIKEVRPVKPLDAFKVEIARKISQGTAEEKTASYIYDKQARTIIKEILQRFDDDLEAIKVYLKKNGLPDYSGNKIEQVRIAEFKEYQSKRDDLTKYATDKDIEKIPYAHKSKLALILKDHIKDWKEEAYTTGLEPLYKKIGSRVKKVTWIEATTSKKFNGSFFETDAGSNVLFRIYNNPDGSRDFETQSVLDVLRNSGPIAEENKDKKNEFTLSPDDFVYLPTKKEEANLSLIPWDDKKALYRRIYRMISSSKKQCFFRPHYLATPIVSGVEIDSNNKIERAFDFDADPTSPIIKQHCLKIRVDILGNVKPSF